MKVSQRNIMIFAVGILVLSIIYTQTGTEPLTQREEDSLYMTADDIEDLIERRILASAVSFPSDWDVDSIDVEEFYLNGEDKTDLFAYPELGASYIIFNSSNVFWARNGETGLIDYGGTFDAGGVDGESVSAVIQAVTDYVSGLGGGTIVLKELQKPINIDVPNNILFVENYQGKEMLYWGDKYWFPTTDSEGALYQFRSERYNTQYELISDFETLGDWVWKSGESAVDDTTNFKEGNQSIKLKSINAVATKYEKTISLNAWGCHFTWWIYVDNVSNLGTIYFHAMTEGGEKFEMRFAGSWTGFKSGSGWSKLTISRADATLWSGAVDADWANISKVDISVKSKSGKTVSVSFDDLRMIQTQFDGKITLRFDDGKICGYTDARNRMDEYGFRGVAAIISSNVGLSTHMSIEQLKHLQECGWDIISHTVTHPDLTTLTDSEIEYELFQCQRWLIENGFAKGSRFFVPPGGTWDTNIMTKIKKYYLGCQSARLNPLHNAIPPADPYLLRRSISVDADTPLAEVQSLIDDTKNYRTWVTIIFHEVSTMTELFQSIIDYIYAQELEVVTFSDVFDDTIIDTAIENSGFVTITNNDYFAHGLARMPTAINLNFMNGIYDGVPVIVNPILSGTNSTHVQVSLYWSNSTAISDELLISYYVKCIP